MVAAAFGAFFQVAWSGRGLLRLRGKQREPKLSLSPTQDTARLEPGSPCSGTGLSWLGGQVGKASGLRLLGLEGQWQQLAGAALCLQGKQLTAEESGQTWG